MFRIGQKVVCVVGLGTLKKGEIYTVHEIIICHTCGHGHISVSEVCTGFGPFSCTKWHGAMTFTNHDGADFNYFRPLSDTFVEEVLTKAIEQGKEHLETQEI
jgi:hypothetical protein